MSARSEFQPFSIRAVRERMVLALRLYGIKAGVPGSSRALESLSTQIAQEGGVNSFIGKRGLGSKDADGLRLGLFDAGLYYRFFPSHQPKVNELAANAIQLSLGEPCSPSEYSERHFPFLADTDVFKRTRYDFRRSGGAPVELFHRVLPVIGLDTAVLLLEDVIGFEGECEARCSELDHVDFHVKVYDTLKHLQWIEDFKEGAGEESLPQLIEPWVRTVLAASERLPTEPTTVVLHPGQPKERVVTDAYSFRDQLLASFHDELVHLSYYNPTVACLFGESVVRNFTQLYPDRLDPIILRFASLSFFDPGVYYYLRRFIDSEDADDQIAAIDVLTVHFERKPNVISIERHGGNWTTLMELFENLSQKPSDKVRLAVIEALPDWYGIFPEHARRLIADMKRMPLTPKLQRALIVSEVTIKKGGQEEEEEEETEGDLQG